MKKKVLVSVLACAMLLLGMGYAYWTDSLQVDTSVSTGELDVRFIDLAIYGQYAGQDNEVGWAIVDGVLPNGYTPDWYFQRGTAYNILAKGTQLDAYAARVWGYTNTTFDAELFNSSKLPKQIGPYTTNTDSSKTIKIDLANVYPGYAQVFQADIANVGTLAAKLSDINLAITDIPNNEMKAMIGVNMKLLREYAGNPSEGHVNVFNTANLTPADTFVLGGVEFIRLASLETLLADDPEILNDLLYVLPDDNRMDLYIGIAMDPDKAGDYTSGWTGDLSDKSDDATQGKVAKFNFTFLWDQFNLDVPTGGSNAQLSN
ncbi:hypothetical protein MASR2M70_02390 [Bacillota bacterium]